MVRLRYVWIVETGLLGELSATAPCRYAEVVFGIIAGIVVFNEYPDLTSYAGMAMVIAAGLYAVRHEAARNRDAKAEFMPPAF